ncbi:unnamed protein product, partial [Dracunculus medinensis]|uniref:VWFA domain-containing protein n=1 Tax=Dracunculus medinensis TaxID=318479 RepID=A0A0N4URS0_DRAME
TETIRNCLNPEWCKPIFVDYYFEEVQRVKFEIGPKSGRKYGEIKVIAEEADDEAKETLQLVCAARNLDKKDLFGKSDPFLQIYRINDDGTEYLLHRTEIIKKTLINEKKMQKKWKKYRNSGVLIFHTVAIKREYSFLDFITRGTQLDFSVAIDLTASNGQINKPGSLHYIGDGQPNEYFIAIRAVADICQHYNNTKNFDAMGFGAKIPPHYTAVNHCFPLNLSDSFCVHGVNGLLDAYRFCLPQCILYGPTNFANVVNEAAKTCINYRKDGSRYRILLIITDGAICDFDQTLSAIISASFLPLSIIIIGVGGEDFESMRRLDSDDSLLRYQGRTAQRDIVQFVALRNFLMEKSISGEESSVAIAKLAKEVLAEIPTQLTSYMKINDIQPCQPKDSSGPLKFFQLFDPSPLYPSASPSYLPKASAPPLL